MCLKHEKHTVNPACFLSILSGVTTLSCDGFKTSQARVSKQKTLPLQAAENSKDGTSYI